jgi:uncharacterized membrane protein YheB (UPF0754 family)
MKAKIREGVVDELSGLLPKIEDKILDSIENNLDMKAIVVEKIEDFDVRKLENIILSIASRELKAIEILGGILGALIGLIQYVLVSKQWIQI